MNYEKLRKNCPNWKAHVSHDFVKQLGNGELLKDNFQYYLKQDYLFLLQFTRAWGLAIYKSDSSEQMRSGQAGVNAMLDFEINLHIEYCKAWGIDEVAIKKTLESSACVAYTRYVLDVGMTGTLAELYAAISPCVLGYAEIGRLLSDKSITSENPYQSWIDTYASEEYQKVTKQTQFFLDELCYDASSRQAEKLQQIFNTATRMEIAFWQMGLDVS